LHTQIFLDQVHANVIGGFLPGTNSPDPNFGKCTQCAAIDRARYSTSPPLPRSAFCQACFAQYCFSPNNLTSAAVQLPGRKLTFVDPDPQGVSAVTGFLSSSKVSIVAGFVVAGVVVAAICAFLCVIVFVSRSISDGIALFFLYVEYGGSVVRCARLRIRR
jgi:lysophospholipase